MVIYFDIPGVENNVASPGASEVPQPGDSVTIGGVRRRVTHREFEYGHYTDISIDNPNFTATYLNEGTVRVVLGEEM